MAWNWRWCLLNLGNRTVDPLETKLNVTTCVQFLAFSTRFASLSVTVRSEDDFFYRHPCNFSLWLEGFSCVQDIMDSSFARGIVYNPRKEQCCG